MRRIVTGWDEQGEPIVLLDDEPPRLVDTEQAKAWEVWIADDTPPDLRDARIRRSACRGRSCRPSHAGRRSG